MNSKCPGEKNKKGADKLPLFLLHRDGDGSVIALICTGGVTIGFTAVIRNIKVHRIGARTGIF